MPPGFSLTELLISLGLIALLGLSLSSSLLYSLHTSAEINQIKTAEQLLQNFVAEWHLQQISHGTSNIDGWQKQAQVYLPNAKLLIKNHNIELSWPSQKTLSIHCTQIVKNHICLAASI